MTWVGRSNELQVRTTGREHSGVGVAAQHLFFPDDGRMLPRSAGDASTQLDARAAARAAVFTCLIIAAQLGLVAALRSRETPVSQQQAALPVTSLPGRTSPQAALPVTSLSGNTSPSVSFAAAPRSREAPALQRESALPSASSVDAASPSPTLVPPQSPTSTPSDAPWWSVPPANAYGVVIVEPREHPALAFVVADTLGKIPPSWNVTVHHVGTNGAFLARELAGELASGRVRLHEVGAALAAQHVAAARFADTVMGNADWWRAIPHDKFILMQTDSAICRRDFGLWERVSQFDYAGAPWHGAPPELHDGGNGGFSWRGKAAALEALRRFDATRREGEVVGNEDVFFTQALFEMRGDTAFRAAPRALCCAFSVESHVCTQMEYAGAPAGGDPERPLAVHKAWAYLDSEQYARVEGACPAMRGVRDRQPAPVWGGWGDPPAGNGTGGP